MISRKIPCTQDHLQRKLKKFKTLIASQIILILFVTILIITIPIRKSDYVRVLEIFPVFLIFILIFVLVDENFAQDRVSYFLWYENVEKILLDPKSSDRAFSYLLSIFPSNLTIDNFSLFLSFILILMLSVVFYKLQSKSVVNYEQAILIIAIICCDRFFLDLTVNTVRSTMAALLIILFILCKGYFKKIFILSIAIGFHAKIAIALLFFYILAIVTKVINIYKFYMYTTIIIVLLFFYKIIFKINFLLENNIINIVKLYSDSESINRGVLLSGELTTNLIFQMIISVFLPILIAIFFQKEKLLKKYSYNSHCSNNSTTDELLRFSQVTLFIAVLLYPEILLAQRFFVIPIILILTLLKIEYLKLILILKFLILVNFLPKYL